MSYQLLIAVEFAVWLLIGVLAWGTVVLLGLEFVLSQAGEEARADSTAEVRVDTAAEYTGYGE